jgi:chromate transport protein ChrA
MTLKSTASYCLDKWWRPVLFSCLSILLLVIAIRYEVNSLIKPSLLLLFISILGLIISFIYQLSKKRWDPATFTFLFLILLVGSMVALYLLVFIATGM